MFLIYLIFISIYLYMMKLIIMIILVIIVFIIYMKKENYTNEGIQMLESIYKDGNVLSEKRINFTKNFLLKYGVIFPSGTILPYFSKYIPTNWKLCDGTNGTPDLRNKYLLGSVSPEDSGGDFEKVIHRSHMPSHQHIVKIRKEGYEDDEVIDIDDIIDNHNKKDREEKEKELQKEISLYINPLKYFNDSDKYKFYTTSGKSTERIYLKPPSVTLNYIIKI